MTRWYAPCYLDIRGTVIPCAPAVLDAESAARISAEVETRWKSLDPEAPEVFVACKEHS